MTFELNITDINDQIPQFKTNYTFDLIENNRIPTIIGQINAYDSDQGINGQITYTIIPPSSYFLITPQEGILSTNTSFDYELKRQYQFQVRARDHGQPSSLESFVSIQINIINVNEYSPQFEKDSYEFSIKENETIEYIGQVKAYDRDYGDTITYSLTNYEDLFTIDQYGRIFTKHIFDREIQDEYKLTVIATDNSTIGSTIVTIKIQYEEIFYFEFLMFYLGILTIILRFSSGRIPMKFVIYSLMIIPNELISKILPHNFSPILFFKIMISEIIL
jgi:hypothetical protein